MLIISERDEHVRLKSYDAIVKGKRSLLTVKIEITDRVALSCLLRELEELMEAYAIAARDKAAAAKPVKPAQRKLSHQPMLALPAPRGDE
jgi:hypothetical protein